MQNLKIYKKSPVMRNIAFFAIFSMLYLHVIESFVGGVSTFSTDSYLTFFNSHKMLLATLFIFCWTLFSGRKYSKYFYLLFISQCIYLAFVQYLVALDKFILILNFLFVIWSYYFYLFMASDLAEASNTPLASRGDVYSGLTLEEPIILKKNDQSFTAQFLNWDESTCFLKIENPAKELRDEIQVEWSFEGNSYQCSGFVVSGQEGLGVGLRLIDTGEQTDGVFGWDDFYDIIHSRGYSPNLTA